MAKFKEVRKAVKRRGLTYAELSEMTGFSVSRISDAVNGRRVAEKVKRSIAMALEEPYEQLWSFEGEEPILVGLSHR